MAEKFDLKTAASIIPLMDNSENSIKQLIDAIQLYHDMLDANGKKHLISYVLKTRLSQNAKIRLSQQYENIDTLFADLRKHFITQKSPVAISVKLHNSKQLGKSIDDFGKTIEQLFVDLTLAQSQEKVENFKILEEVNEKLAINAFTNGLNNSELKTIIKARNYKKLNEVIRATLDENEQMQMHSQHSNMLHMHKNRGNSRPQFTNSRGRFFHAGNRNFATNYNRQNFHYNSNNSGTKNANNFNNQRGFSRNNYRRNFNHNANHFNQNRRFNNNPRVNTMQAQQSEVGQTSVNQVNSTTQAQNAELTFFRG